MSDKNKPTSHSEKHVFAFYLQNTSIITEQRYTGDELRIEDKDLCRRIQHVIKLEKDDIFFVFDQTHNVQLKLKQITSKKYILGQIIKKEKNTILTPHITFMLPVLKKEHFEYALYALVELGAQTIQPIITQKSQQAFKIKKMYNRFSKIIIAAAEQSKNFAFPTLKEPMELYTYLEDKKNGAIHIFFDPEGIKIDEIIKKIKNKPNKQITLMIGPEGDLTPEEKIAIQKQGFLFCKLTPTVLRAYQAVSVGLGICRSLLY